jgi:hypothetical protein
MSLTRKEGRDFSYDKILSDWNFRLPSLGFKCILVGLMVCNFGHQFFFTDIKQFLLAHGYVKFHTLQCRNNKLLSNHRLWCNIYTLWGSSSSVCDGEHFVLKIHKLLFDFVSWQNVVITIVSMKQYISIMFERCQFISLWKLMICVHIRFVNY